MNKKKQWNNSYENLSDPSLYTKCKVDFVSILDKDNRMHVSIDTKSQKSALIKRNKLILISQWQQSCCSKQVGDTFT